MQLPAPAVTSPCPPPSISSPAAAAPIDPLTQSSSPGRPPLRGNTRRGLASPTAVTSTTSGPGLRVRLPPMTSQPNCCPSAALAPTIASTSTTCRSPGRTRDSNAHTGLAPMAAKSLKLTASARCPMSAGAEYRRSKCTPSTCASVVSTVYALRVGATTAASSPIPMTRLAFRRPVVLNRAWILASKARSPSSDTVTPGPRAKEGGRIPLCRVGRIAEPASAGGVAVEAAL